MFSCSWISLSPFTTFHSYSPHCTCPSFQHVVQNLQLLLLGSIYTTISAFWDAFLHACFWSIFMLSGKFFSLFFFFLHPSLDLFSAFPVHFWCVLPYCRSVPYRKNPACSTFVGGTRSHCTGLNYGHWNTWKYCSFVMQIKNALNCIWCDQVLNGKVIAEWRFVPIRCFLRSLEHDTKWMPLSTFMG